MAELVRTDEQRLLAEATRGFLADKAGLVSARAHLADVGAYDVGVWKQMADGLGLQGLALSEQYGGGGFGFADLAVVLEELGRVLYSGPFLSTCVLSVGALLAARDERVAADLLPAVAAGELTVTLVPRATDRHSAANPVRAARDATGWRLRGTSAFVLDGATADRLLVAVDTPYGAGLFDIDASTAGVRRTPLPTLDLTRRQARIELDAVPARLVGRLGEADDVVARALQVAAVGLAAEQVGGAQRCLEMSVAYANTRHQFGRAIGSFQAIKHKCADMLLQIESARSAARYAAWTADGADRGELAEAAALAGAYCSQIYFRVAAETVQIHGGIGFTWEHDAHLYFRRAKADEVLFGTPREHRRELVRLLGLEPDAAR